MRFITLSHGLHTHTKQVEDNVTTSRDILNDDVAMTDLGVGGNVVLRDQDGNEFNGVIHAGITSLSVTNQGSTKG